MITYVTHVLCEVYAKHVYGNMDLHLLSLTLTNSRCGVYIKFHSVSNPVSRGYTNIPCSMNVVTFIRNSNLPLLATDNKYLWAIFK